MKIEPDEPCPCGSGREFKLCHGPRVRAPSLPKITERYPLTVIPEPDPGARAVFVHTGEGTVVFSGREGGLAQCCGTCGAPLIVGCGADQLHGIVLKCNGCGAFNEVVRSGSV